MEDFNTYDRSWIKRALDPNTPTTVAKETVKTASSEFNGKEILFPTIRLIDGKLKKFSLKDAFNIAIEKKDFISFNTPVEATAYSKGLSGMINVARGKNKSILLRDN
jgi:hypothetical protein